MRPRATRDLSQLADSDFLCEIANGMTLVLANASALLTDAQALADANRRRAASIMQYLCAEEAAKLLILLDAVRCPRAGDAFARQLGRFNDHLAKGIYVKYYGTRPATFGESLEYIDLQRKEYYLDGPNDVDWIFRNWILQNREEILYVDYVETDEGHLWLTPVRFETLFSRARVFSPSTLRISQSLAEAGFVDPKALAIVADMWRPITFAADSHWETCHRQNIATLEALNRAGLLTESGAKSAGAIAWEWLFPLHTVDLSMIKVDRGDLRDIQARWTPDI